MVANHLYLPRKLIRVRIILLHIDHWIVIRFVSFLICTHLRDTNNVTTYRSLDSNKICSLSVLAPPAVPQIHCTYSRILYSLQYQLLVSVMIFHWSKFQISSQKLHMGLNYYVVNERRYKIFWKRHDTFSRKKEQLPKLFVSFCLHCFNVATPQKLVYSFCIIK